MLLGSSFRSPSYPPSMGMDSIAGGRRPRGLLGSSSIVATPEQEEESRRMAEMLGMPGPNDMPQQQQPQQQPSMGQPGMGQPQQQQGGTTLGELVGTEPERPKGFWQGGGKFGVRDGVATALAVLGDAFAQQGGGRGGGGFSAVDMLTKGRATGNETYKEKLAEYNRNRKIAGLPGMSPREFAAFSMDPKAWGSNNSDALSTHHAAANVSPGEQRVFGNPNMGGSVYQAPTGAEQYAGALGEVAQTPGFRTALQDYVLRGSGPTAFDYDSQLDDVRTDNDMSLEGLRQRNRIGMEGVRQGNRSELRSAPTYRDMNPPAPRARAATAPRKSAPTATGPNGEKLQFVGGKWVPLR